MREGASRWRRELAITKLDLLAAARGLRRRPVFAVLAIGTLAVGIGASAALFAVVDAVLLRPLPYPEPERLVSVWATHESRGRYGASLQDYEDWRDRTSVFESIGAFAERSGTLTGELGAQQVAVGLVTPELLRALDLRPTRGRWFEEAENDPGRDGVVLLSDGLWRERFAADPEVVGAKLLLDGKAVTVVGVLPPAVGLPSPGIALWKPFGMHRDDAGGRDGRWTRVVGRLREGIDLEVARAEVAILMEHLAAEYPLENAGFRAELEPLRRTVAGESRGVLSMLAAAVGLVLLVACLNVAQLVRARAARRGGVDLALRGALGASRGRVARGLLTESLVLTAGGGLAAVGVAALVLRLLPLLGVLELPRADGIGLGGRTVAFVALLSTVATLLIGLGPALRSSALALRAPGRERSVARGGGRRARRSLVVVELAATVVLLVGATLLARSLGRVLDESPGFEPAGLLRARIEPPWRTQPGAGDPDAFRRAIDAERAARAPFFDDLVERLGTLPGVASVGLVNSGPMSGNRWNTELEVAGRPVEPSAQPHAQYRVVSGDYFATLGIPIEEGRPIGRSDRAGGRPVAVVSRAFARAWLPSGEAIGARLAFPEGAEFEVVGVAGDVANASLEEGGTPLVYLPFEQCSWGYFGSWRTDLFLRTTGDPGALADSVRSVVRELDPDLPVTAVAPGTTIVASTLGRRLLATRVVGSFAVVALLLSAVGLFAVLHLGVRLRRSEMGVRGALGATRAELVRLVVGESLGSAAIGLGLGAVASALLGRFLGSLLFGVTVLDVPSYLAAASAVGLVALAASWAPALAAARVPPAESLRAD